MTIPLPKAVYGEIVNVLNYRCKPPRWEEGTVTMVQYVAQFSGEFSWSYQVAIDRPVVERAYRRSTGGGYGVLVRDDAVEPIE